MTAHRPQDRAGMSEREYAAHAGISRGAVQKARTSGRLVLHADGSIDAAASDARRAQATDPAMQRGRQRSPLRPVPEAAVGAVSETLREQGLPAPSAASGMGTSADAKGVTYLQARTANEVLKAQERKMRLQKLRGELVDRARATAVVFRLARQERDAWAGWPARIAAMMAADLGISAHKMQTVLETHVRQHLGELADVRPDLR
jgi:hypothetical protein